MTGLPTARVLTIAGSDSGGGAGIQADLKTMLAYGVHGMSVLTAVTAQNSVGVQGVWPLPLQAIEQQFRSVVDDIGVDAVKIGMLGRADVVECVSGLLTSLPAEVPVVLDPVCVSKHGDALVDEEAIVAIREVLLQQATVVTPNLPEAAVLAGRPGSLADGEVAAVAAQLRAMGPEWVLVKGGHRSGEPVDHLLGPFGATELAAHRANNAHTHGTGCTLSSAVACELALGRPMVAAVRGAKEYVTGAIRGGFALGRGIGPTDHLWRLRRLLPPAVRTGG